MSEPQAPSSDTVVNAVVTEEDTHFKRKLTWISIAFMTFSGMVGSGWLFASYHAAGLAGPLALVSWIIAAIATAFVGMSFIELGVTRPIVGGNSRWPAMNSGPFVGVMMGWVLLVQAAIGTPSEASGLLQYSAYWWPEMVQDGKLSAIGMVLAIIVLIFFTFLNWFGVVLMARINTLITIFKIAVPVLTVILLIATGFDSSNFGESGGGFAPYGTAAMLTAVIGAGMIYSFGGIQTGAVMAGEARKPRRDIPLGTFVGFGAAFVLYVFLQISYLGAVPNDMLAEAGWHGINFESPLANLAMLLNIGWLTQLLLVDAMVSPAGSLFLGIGLGSRNTYGLAQTRVLPKWIAHVHVGSGIARRALLINLVISIIFLLLFQSWQALVAALGMFFAVGYAIIAVAAGVNSRDPKLHARPWLRSMRYLAPISFMISGLIMYWAGWGQVKMALIIFAVSIPLFLFLMSRDRKILTPRTFVEGLWFVGFMAFVGLLSFLGNFGGIGALPGPWDSVIVAVGSLGFYLWGAKSSLTWMRSPESEAAAGQYY